MTYKNPFIWLVILLGLYYPSILFADDTTLESFSYSEIGIPELFYRPMLTEFNGYLYMVGDYAQNYFDDADKQVVYRTKNFLDWEFVIFIEKQSEYDFVTDIFSSNDKLYILQRPDYSKNYNKAVIQYTLLESNDGQNFTNVIDDTDSISKIEETRFYHLVDFNNKIFFTNTPLGKTPRLHVSNDGDTWTKEKFTGWAFDQDYTGHFKKDRLTFNDIIEHNNELFAIVEQNGYKRHALIKSADGIHWQLVSSSKDALWFNKVSLATGRVHLVSSGENLYMITPSHKGSGLHIYSVTDEGLELSLLDPDIHILEDIVATNDGYIAKGYAKSKKHKKAFIYTTADGLHWSKQYKFEHHDEIDYIFEGTALETGLGLRGRPL